MAQRAVEDLETHVIEIECSISRDALKLVLDAVFKGRITKNYEINGSISENTMEEALEFVRFLELAAEGDA